MAKLATVFVVVILEVYFMKQATSGSGIHHCTSGDLVPVYANKFGAFHNPSETYGYCTLPFCQPVHVEKKRETFGEALNGDHLFTAPFQLHFLKSKDHEVVCRKNLTAQELAQFRLALKQDCYVQMYVDDLPIWAFIGRLNSLDPINADDRQYFLYNHYIFEVYYNKDQIIETNAYFKYYNYLDLTKDKETYMELLYSVKWKQIEVPFGDRLRKYSHYSSLTHHLDAHGFSIMSSKATLILLIGCLLMYYMRAIKKDFHKYEHQFSPDEESSNGQEERGWKYVCCDVFHHPHHKSLLAAVIGTGTQLCTITIFILLLGVLGVFYPYNRGNLLVALVVLYAVSSGVAGYVAVSFYCQLEGTDWVKNLMLTGSVSYGPLFLTFCFLNTVARAYKANAELSFHTILVVSSIWMLGALPMLSLGGVVGRKFYVEFGAPCEVSKCPRESPPLCWYRGAPVQMVLAGILPFCVTYTEIYYILASMWGQMIYTSYHVLVIVFILLLISTSLAAAALTHIQLAAEDHRWWWRSFLCGGSTGVYMYLYCFYYYYAWSNFSGFLQTSFFFGYMACICYGFFLMLSAMGFSASLLYVCHIYSSIKSD